MFTPHVGAFVLYRLRDGDAEQINRRRAHAKAHMPQHRANATGVMVHVGNAVSGGDVYPMLITRTWGNTPQSLVNGTVFLDGSDTFWACSVGAGEESGMWQAPG